MPQVIVLASRVDFFWAENTTRLPAAFQHPEGAATGNYHELGSALRRVLGRWGWVPAPERGQSNAEGGEEY